MAGTAEHNEPALDRKAVALVLILLSIVAAGLAYAMFNPHTHRSDGPALAFVGVVLVLLYADRRLATWLDGFSWNRLGLRKIIGLDGTRMLNIGVGILLVITGIVIYTKPLL